MLEQIKQQAENFLTLLDEESEEFTFQTFTDSPEDRENFPVASNGKRYDPLAKVLNGDIDVLFEKLVDLNNKGAGVYVTVNKTDLTGRTLKNMVGVRALWQEDDGDGKDLPCNPHIVVESSPGHYHRYVLVDGITPDQFKVIQGRMVSQFGSDPNAKDYSRVLRLPGFLHLKRKSRPHMVSIVDQSNELPFDIPALERVFPRTPPEETNQQTASSAPQKENTNAIRLTPEQLTKVFDYGSGSYDDWFKVGMVIHNETVGSDYGLSVWKAWSSSSDKYNSDECVRKWDSFGKTDAEPMTFATLFWGDKEEVPELYRKFQFRPFMDLAKEVKPTQWLIKGVAVTESMAVLYGAPGSYKSFIATEMMMCIATGEPLWGKDVTQGTTAMIIGEGQNSYGKRGLAWMRARGYDNVNNFYVSTVPAQLTIEDSARVVGEAIEALPGDVVAVCIDTLNRNFGPGDENSTSDMSLFVANLDNFIGRKMLKLVVHHTGLGNDSRARGSSVLRASLDSEYMTKADDGQCTFSCTKMKDGPKFNDLNLKTTIIDMPQNILPGENSIVLDVDANVKAAENLSRQPTAKQRLITWLSETEFPLRTTLRSNEGFKTIGFSTWASCKSEISKLKNEAIVVEKDGLFIVVKQNVK